jgi:hypothetical protein
LIELQTLDLISDIPELKLLISYWIPQK